MHYLIALQVAGFIILAGAVFVRQTYAELRQRFNSAGHFINSPRLKMQNWTPNSNARSSA